MPCLELHEDLHVFEFLGTSGGVWTVYFDSGVEN